MRVRRGVAGPDISGALLMELLNTAFSFVVNAVFNFFHRRVFWTKKNPPKRAY